MKIRTWRKRKKMSQEELARLLGVSRFSIIKWEADKCAPSPKIARKIVDMAAGEVAFGDLM